MSVLRMSSSNQRLCACVFLLSLPACSASLEETNTPRRGEELGAAGSSAAPSWPPPAPYTLVANDTFDARGWWFARGQSGNGYVSRRSEARSPSRVGDEYGNNPIGSGEELGKGYQLDFVPTDCVARAWVHPLTPVQSVTIDTFDTPTHHTVRSWTAFPELPGHGDAWQSFDNTAATQESGFTSNRVSVRLILEGAGVWQEALFDDVSVYCK